MDFSSTDEENNAIISTNNLNQTVTLLLLKQLRVGMPLQADLVSIIFGMLQTRDEKIFEVHKNRHKNNDHYKEFKRNVFLPSSIYCDLKSDNITFDVVQYFPVSLPPLLFVDISSVRYIFIPVLIGENDLDKDDWELIYVDCLAKLIFVVDPKKRIFNPDKLV
jgi:hypothetical protein